MTPASIGGGQQISLSGGCQSPTEIYAQLHNAPQEHCYACIGTRGCALDSVWKMSADADPNPAQSLASETCTCVYDRPSDERIKRSHGITIQKRRQVSSSFFVREMVNADRNRIILLRLTVMYGHYRRSYFRRRKQIGRRNQMS